MEPGEDEIKWCSPVWGKVVRRHPGLRSIGRDRQNTWRNELTQGVPLGAVLELV